VLHVALTSGRIGSSVLLERSSHESGIEICPDLNDLATAEPAKPTVPAVELEAIFRGGKGMQFNYRPVSTHRCVLHLKSRTLRQDLRQVPLASEILSDTHKMSN
jgi:hypothetical protein